MIPFTRRPPWKQPLKFSSFLSAFSGPIGGPIRPDKRLIELVYICPILLCFRLEPLPDISDVNLRLLKKVIFLHALFLTCARSSEDRLFPVVHFLFIFFTSSLQESPFYQPRISLCPTPVLFPPFPPYREKTYWSKDRIFKEIGQLLHVPFNPSPPSVVPQSGEHP